jgi:tRNA A-37 threonylcarbamoyl transferase component Bud32
MAFLEINPTYQEFLRRQGLVSADVFLRLPGVVIAGHPDRHVAQVAIGSGADAVAAFLKREHRVRWKDRLANACVGFGFVSKAVREALLLQLLPRAGVAGPEWIAVGEDDRGRAFVLVRELTGCLDLRVFLRQLQSAPPGRRRHFACRLGEAVARLHDAGFAHGDLYAKHVLVEPHTEAVYFLDWQRSSYQVRVGWRPRRRDLAALHASLADDLARPRERLACLGAYLRSAGRPGGSVRRLGRSIRRVAEGLLRRRHVREQHQPPLGAGTQNLIWLDGEALCVTREFLGRCHGEVSRWLADSGMLSRKRLTNADVMLPDGGRASLARRREFRPLSWLWGHVRRRRPVSPELRQAGLLFRLQRYGIVTPRLLAVGQRQTAPGWVESFLLTEPPPDAVPLADWLSKHGAGRHLFDEALTLLRRLHEAGCHLDPADSTCPLLVQTRPGEAPVLALGSVAAVAAGRDRAGNDAALLRREFARAEPAAGHCLAGRQP